MRSLIFLELLAFAVAAPPDPSPIRLPAVQQAAPPQPMPADAAIVLTPDVLYVVEADVPCLTFLSPGGAVRFTKEAGPLTVRGKFVGGTGSETKKFTGKHVYLFEAVREGRDELIIVPVGSTDEGSARRVTFSVQGARPPPEVDPVKPIDPKPDVKPVTSFRVIIGYESGSTYPQAVINVLYGRVVEEWLTANCTGGKAGWRRRDKDAAGDADPTMAALWASVKPSVTTVPFFAVEVNGKVEIIPFEATPEAMVAKLNTYRGNK